MLFEKLSAYKDSNQPVAYYRWADGTGLLIGRVAELTPMDVTFDQLDGLGRRDGTEGSG